MQSSARARSTVFIDTVAPEKPVLLRPLDGTAVTTTSPTLDGVAVGADVIELLVDDVVAFTQSARQGARVTLQTEPLSAGAHTWSLRASDAAGNSSSATASFEVKPPVAVGCSSAGVLVPAALLGAMAFALRRRRR